MPAVNHWPTVITDLSTLILAVWPEITEWSEVGDMEKFEWQNVQRSGAEKFPFVIIFTDEFAQVPGACSAFPWYGGDITLYYIARDNADIITTLRDRLSQMEYALRTREFNVLDPRGNYRMNWSPSNPANTKLQGQKLPATAGAITFTAWIPGTTVQT